MLGEAQNWRCAYCGVRLRHVHAHADEATLDEVVPRCAGGLRVWANQVLACRICNSGRGSIPADVYFAHVVKWGRYEAARWGRKCRHQRRVLSFEERRRGPERVLLARFDGIA
jgi:5-methylcytosine-specific restriction endonuclease McrA